MWLLKEHWVVLFIVHIYVIVVSLHIDQIPINIIK
jgi:hypothetical protein